MASSVPHPLCVVLLALCPVLTAQEEQPEEPLPRPDQVPDAVLEEGKTPEEYRRSRVFNDASKYVNFVASVHPRRVPPGGQATMTVTMSLKGDMVFTAPPEMEFTHRREQNAIVVGAPSFRPASEGKLAPAFLGHPVYDDYAIFDVPLQVAGDAAEGKHTVRLSMEFPLTDGRSGQFYARFRSGAGAQVHVGEPVPEPLVRIGDGTDGGLDALPAGRSPDSRDGSGSDGDAGEGAADPDGGGGDSGPEITGRVQEPEAREGLGGASPAGTPDPAEPLPEGSSALTPILIGGGVFVLLLLGLVGLRARGR